MSFRPSRSSVNGWSRRQWQIPTTQMPFLYETASLSQRPICTAPYRFLFACEKQHTRREQTRTITNLPRFHLVRTGSDDDPVHDDYDEPVMPKKSGGSTITDAERATFNRIFEDIMTSTPGFDNSKDFFDGVDEEWDPIAREDIATSRSQGPETLNDIFASALSTNDSDPTIRAVAKYPHALRAAAARASGLFALERQRREQLAAHEEMDEATSAELQRVKQEQQSVEEYRLAELSRVEQMMRSAQTDFKLWEVLQKEVFALAMKVEKEGKRSRRKRIKAEDSTSTKQKGGREVVTPQLQIPALAVAGPNYPHLLLLAMRLLKYDFRAPVLCLSLFYQVKALGLTSYVLGASTALYNEVLEIKWRQCNDLSGVVDLLKEMEANGVEYDERTMDLLIDIFRESKLVLAGLRGEGLKVVWQTRRTQWALGMICPTARREIHRRKQAGT